MTPGVNAAEGALERVGRRLMWLAVVLALGPGTWWAMGEEMAANEAVYATGCCEYPVALKSIGYGFTQGLGLGFGTKGWAQIDRLTSNEPPSTLLALRRYRVGGASKEHPYAWVLGVAGGWMTAVTLIAAAYMKFNDAD